VRAPLRDGLGLSGSGVIVMNPPYGLAQAMEQLMPSLVQHLGQDNRARGEVRQADSPAEIKTALSPTGLSAASSPK
jgi:23S rRNA A2030 N6-methylase RlmJ